MSRWAGERMVTTPLADEAAFDYSLSHRIQARKLPLSSVG